MTDSIKASRMLSEAGIDQRIADYLYEETTKLDAPISMTACLVLARHIHALSHAPEAGKPVAWRWKPSGARHHILTANKPAHDSAEPLYAHPPEARLREVDLRRALEFGILSCSGPTNDAEIKMLDKQIEETWQEYRAALAQQEDGK